MFCLNLAVDISESFGPTELALLFDKTRDNFGFLRLFNLAINLFVIPLK